MTSADSAGKAETSKNGRSICPNSQSSILPFSSPFSFLLSLFKQRRLPTGAEARTHRPHSISEFLSLQMIFFSPLANIDFLSFVSLELCSPRLRLLSLCCCRSSITARKTLTIMWATYLLLLSQQRKHKSTKASRRKMVWWLIPL